MPPAEHSSRGSFGFWLTISFVGLAFYVLGLGPAVKVVRANPSTLPYLAAIYGPLDKASSHVQPFRRVLDWYVKAWTGN